MEKFKRYLGLAAAAGLLILGFTPIGSHAYFSRASLITMLDSTVLTHITLRGDMKPFDGDMYFWLIATDYFNSCPPFQKASIRNSIYDTINNRNCDGNGFLFSTLSQIHKLKLTAIEPRFPALLMEYEAAINAASNNLNDRSDVVPGNSHVDTDNAKRRRLASELQVGNVMNRYLQTRQASLATHIYLVHAFLVLVVFFIAGARQFFGGLIWFPISLIANVARVAGRAVKTTHDRI